MGRRLAALLCVLATLTAGCVRSTGGGQAKGDAPKGCSVIQVTVSPEKLDLMTTLAAEFNASSESKRAASGACAFAKVKNESSGAGADALTAGWINEQTDGPKPTIWSPASAAWGAVVNQRLADAGRAPTVPPGAQPFMLTPLVIAMPKPMADAIGYPGKPIGFQDIVALSQDPSGWGALGHPEWGAFKLGKTSPKFSTSALSATIAQYYTAVKKTQGLTLEDVNRPDVAEFNKKIESSVVHYGDTTLTFLNNWFRNDQRGTALTYVSALAVEEKSVIDYNHGIPDGIRRQGDRPRPPKVPLVAIYPKDGTLFSDSPLFILDAPWVTPAQKEGAKAFQSFVQQPDKQKRVLEFGFRPANPAIQLADPIIAANGVDPAQPSTTLGVPEPPVLSAILTKWSEQRKGAQLLLVVDVSGSMGDPVAGADGQTKLDLAKKAAVNALDELGPNDLVGLRIFSTNVNPKPPGDYLDLVPITRLSEAKETLKTKIRALVPTSGTPLYTTAVDSYKLLQQNYQANLINAVVLLTDGTNEDDRNNDLNATVNILGAGREGAAQKPVRLFTIGFGTDADMGVLTRMSEATDAKAYDSKDPNAIDRVFTSVISNF